jgi:hypothetical protein
MSDGIHDGYAYEQEKPKKYTLLWIPKSGLHYQSGLFFDGFQMPINWDRTIQVFASHARAETAKQRILDRFPDAKGELVVLPVTVQEIE